mmetsp:Transcript_7542/g.15432  ORF Transcript_7542/g.15432 Transcript_7542/m.15432 type:complete len:217 (-) Transcript_7542:187-837(-)
MMMMMIHHHCDSIDIETLAIHNHNNIIKSSNNKSNNNNNSSIRRNPHRPLLPPMMNNNNGVPVLNEERPPGWPRFKGSNMPRLDFNNSSSSNNNNKPQQWRLSSIHRCNNNNNNRKKKKKIWHPKPPAWEPLMPLSTAVLLPSEPLGPNCWMAWTRMMMISTWTIPRTRRMTTTTKAKLPFSTTWCSATNWTRRPRNQRHSIGSPPVSNVVRRPAK